MRLSREKLLEYLILYGLTPTLFLVKSYQVVTFLIVALFCYDIIRRKDWSVFNDTIFKIFSFCVCIYLSVLFGRLSQDLQ
jgi:uncharacterized membrane protein